MQWRAVEKLYSQEADALCSLFQASVPGQLRDWRTVGAEAEGRHAPPRPRHENITMWVAHRSEDKNLVINPTKRPIILRNSTI
jgi:hypothetical protein